MSWEEVPRARNRFGRDAAPLAVANKAGGSSSRNAVRLSFNVACRSFLPEMSQIVLLRDGPKRAVRLATEQDNNQMVRRLTTTGQVSATGFVAIGQRFRLLPPDEIGIIVLEPIEGG